MEGDARQHSHRSCDIDLSHDDEREFAQWVLLPRVEAADEHQHHVAQINDEDVGGVEMGCYRKGATEQYHASEAVEGADDVALARHIDECEVLPEDAEREDGEEDDEGVWARQDGPNHQSDQQEAGDGALNQTGEFHC